MHVNGTSMQPRTICIIRCMWEGKVVHVRERRRLFSFRFIKFSLSESIKKKKETPARKRGVPSVYLNHGYKYNKQGY